MPRRNSTHSSAPFVRLAGALCFISAAAAGCEEAPGASERRDSGTDGAAIDHDGSGGAELVEAPHLIAPLSTATVTSRQPHLRWQLGGDTDGVHVQICRDRDCTTEVTGFDADGTDATVSNDLPLGVLFWRAQGRRKGIIGAVATPTWQFTVGSRNAAVKTSWGTIADVNGDAHADILVGAPSGMGGLGAAYLYEGGSDGPAPSPTVSLSSEGVRNFGAPVTGAGDTNGDGFSDVIVAAIGLPGDTGAAYLYLGSRNGLSALPSVTLTGPDGPDGLFGHSAASAGDVNGDGYCDVIVGAPRVGDSETGRVYLYLGSVTGLGAVPAIALTGPDGAHGRFGHALAGAGDVNGDGYADIIVGADGASNYTGRVYLYLGGSSGPGGVPDAVLESPDGINGYFGISVASADDVNGDGYADVLVGANGVDAYAGRAYVYLGGSTGLGQSPAVKLAGPGGALGVFGTSLTSAGDVNNDGYADVLVGAYREDANLGRAYLYLGNPTGPASIPDATLAGLTPNGRFGRSVAGAGDVDRDGYADIVVGADGNISEAPGWAYFFAGSAMGVGSSPTLTLTGLEGYSAFGNSVASLQAPAADLKWPRSIGHRRTSRRPEPHSRS